MTKFYGEKTPFSTVSYSEFANNYIKRATLPTVEPLDTHVSNTWQKLESKLESADVLKDWQTPQEKIIIDDKGNVKVLLVSAPAEHEISFIDWVTVTFKRYLFLDDYLGKSEEDINDICVERMEQKLDSIFGFKLGKKRKNGKNFYQQCYEITNHEGDSVGYLCIGGQANSIMMSITGNGCLKGDYGWQERLYNFLLKAPSAKITRLDLSHDDMDGTYLDIDDLNERETCREFYYFGKPARVTWHGDWKYMDRDKLGRTLEIGCRESDKLMRAYEKGKQLGDKTSEWLRLEVELKSKHTHIPLNALIKPSDYFINLYPCFKDLFQYDDQAQSRIEYVKRATEIIVEKGKQILRHQFGSWLGFFRQWYDSDKECLDALASEFNIPKRFSITKQDWSRILPNPYEIA